jgi:hypothetical protein
MAFHIVVDVWPVYGVHCTQNPSENQDKEYPETGIVSGKTDIGLNTDLHRTCCGYFPEWLSAAD